MNSMGTLSPSTVWAPEVIKALVQIVRKETATGVFSNFILESVFEFEDRHGVKTTIFNLKIHGAGIARREFPHAGIKEMLDKNDFLKAKQVFYEFSRRQQDD